MKTFTFDEYGNLTVSEVVTVVVEGGGESQEVEQETSRSISAAQLAVHLPMLVVDMSPDDLLQAQTIIKGLAGA
ncbi:hypothetical protein [Methylobacillus flagellatus]|nr:hypothetical protein [Methylobacillus flagellatus]ABZ07579.1 hypothetical protein ALOHA_HF4000ANIW137K11ctg1g6 [uncultured marine microorganism HF4000_ANIW137K11]